MAYADQSVKAERALAALLASQATAFPVAVWGDDSLDLKLHPVAAFVTCEAETPALLARQILRATVTVRSAATADADRTALDSACATLEPLITGAAITLGTDVAFVAVAPAGWGQVQLTADNFWARAYTARLFVHF